MNERTERENAIESAIYIAAVVDEPKDIKPADTHTQDVNPHFISVHLSYANTNYSFRCSLSFYSFLSYNFQFAFFLSSLFHSPVPSARM